MTTQDGGTSRNRGENGAREPRSRDHVRAVFEGESPVLFGLFLGILGVFLLAVPLILVIVLPGI